MASDLLAIPKLSIGNYNNSQAKKFQFTSVCVNPSFIKFVADQLEGSGVAPCVGVGFPLGATMPEVKVAETDAVSVSGAKEVDMVANIGAIKSGD